MVLVIPLWVACRPSPGAPPAAPAVVRHTGDSADPVARHTGPHGHTGATGPLPDTWATDCGGTPSTTTPGACVWISDYLLPQGAAEATPQLRVFGPDGCLLDVRDTEWVREVEADGTRWVVDDPTTFHRVDPDGTVIHYLIDPAGAYEIGLREVARLADGTVLGLVGAKFGYSDDATWLDRWGLDGTWLERWYDGAGADVADVAVGTDGAAWIVKQDSVRSTVWRASPPTGGATSVELVAELADLVSAVAVTPSGEVLVALDESLVISAIEGSGARVVFDSGTATPAGAWTSRRTGWWR